MAHGGDIYRNKVEMDFSVNLNPVPVPEALSEALRRGIREAGFYPDPEQEDVRNALARLEGVGKDCVFAGNGASSLILAAVRAVSPGRALLIEPGFSGYRHALRSLRSCEIREYFLKEEDGFALTEEALGALEGGVDMVFLSDPWNPTGQNIDEEVLLLFLEAAREKGAAVLLDQSFFLLSRKGAGGTGTPGALLAEYGNLIIIRSFTKLFALPGIRMGYCLTAPEMIRKLQSQLPEWELSSPAASCMKAGAEMLAGDEALAVDYEGLERERTFLASELVKRGLVVYPSDTIYLLVRVPEGGAGRPGMAQAFPSDLFRALLGRGILIRDCGDYPGLERRSPDTEPFYFRIAVRDHFTNMKFLDALDDLAGRPCGS